MGKESYIRMKTDQVSNQLISSDLKEIGAAAKKLATHVISLGSLGFGTTFLEWIASFSAMYAPLSLSLSLSVPVCRCICLVM
jgi:hypothetical protein